MTDNSFKYDVAISFLDDDEPLARDISQRLTSSGLDVFVYSERQADLVGTDGVEKFSNVFGRDARIVVVLHRAKWGTTKWTRIEETAIKARVFDDGANFLTFVPIEKPFARPSWLDPIRIWLDYERLGIEGAVAIIEERVRQAGAAVREESVEEAFGRLRLEEEREARRRAFVESYDGVAEANKTAGELFDYAYSVASKAGLAVTRAPYGVAVYRDGYTVVIGWYNPAANITSRGRLRVIEWRGRPDFGGQRYHRFSEPEELRVSQMLFDIADGDQVVWRDETTGRVRTNQRVADDAIKRLLQLVRERPGDGDDDE